MENPSGSEADHSIRPRQGRRDSASLDGLRCAGDDESTADESGDIARRPQGRRPANTETDHLGHLGGEDAVGRGERE